MTEITLAVCHGNRPRGNVRGGVCDRRAGLGAAVASMAPARWVNRWIKIVEEQTVEETNEGRPE